MSHPASHRLTVAQALIQFLSRQYTERDGRRHRLVDACWGIFGHGNVAGIGEDPQRLCQETAEVGGARRIVRRGGRPCREGRGDR
jgi:TPP-dependent trihydroxycyclohexane-1,2-dione (THcHDO) dehydratase